MLVVISSIALLVLLLTYFKHIRTLFYVEGNCTVTTSFYTVQVNETFSLILGEQSWTAGKYNQHPLILIHNDYDHVSHRDNVFSESEH